MHLADEMRMSSSESWGYARWLVNRAYEVLKEPDDLGSMLWEMSALKWTDVPRYDRERLLDAEELRTEFVQANSGHLFGEWVYTRPYSVLEVLLRFSERVDETLSVSSTPILNEMFDNADLRMFDNFSMTRPLDVQTFVFVLHTACAGGTTPAGHDSFFPLPTEWARERRIDQRKLPLWEQACNYTTSRVTTGS